jgi:hypothetical protein
MIAAAVGVAISVLIEMDRIKDYAGVTGAKLYLATIIIGLIVLGGVLLLVG